MTVVVWDGKTLAADKRCTYGNSVRTVTKITRVGADLFGIAGSGELGMEVIAWIEAGAEPAHFPAAQRVKDENVNLMMVRDGRVFEFGRTPFPVIYEDRCAAIGSGRDFAIAAMHCGKTAKEAVEIACLFDVDCGGGVDTLEFEP